MKLDGTLNINTLIVAGSLLVSGALAYATLDKRISLQEQQSQLAVQQANERATETRDAVRNVNAELKELRNKIEQARR
jgi:hypothetical protein